MANSPRIRQALTEVFAELSAMTPTQLNAQLEQRKIGAIGQLLLDAGAFADSWPEPTKGTNKVAILTNNLTSSFTKVKEFLTSPSQRIARELKPNYTANSPYA